MKWKDKRLGWKVEDGRWKFFTSTHPNSMLIRFYKNDFLDETLRLGGLVAIIHSFLCHKGTKTQSSHKGFGHSLYKLNYVSFFTLFLLMFCSPSLFAQQDSLNSYLKQVAANNPALKASFNQYMSALQEVDITGTLPDPRAAFGYFISPVETRVGAQRAKISLSQMFPWFGKLSYEKKAATEHAKEKYAAFTDAKNKLFKQVKTTWYQYYDLQQKIRITKENITIVKSDKSLANVRYASGMVGMTDVLRAEMEIANLQEQLEFLQDSKEPINAKFNQLLNTQGKTMVVPDSLPLSSIPMDETVTLDSVLANNPKLQQLGHQSQALQNQLTVAKKSAYPNFSVAMDYVFVDKRTDMTVADNGKDAFMPMVGLSLPIHQKKYKAMQQAVQYKIDATGNATDNIKNSLQTQLSAAFRDYHDAQRRIKLYRYQKQLAQQSLEILTTAYSTAGKNFEEVLRMNRKLLKDELELQKAYTDLNVSVAKIEYLMGK